MILKFMELLRFNNEQENNSFTKTVILLLAYE